MAQLKISGASQDQIMPKKIEKSSSNGSKSSSSGDKKGSKTGSQNSQRSKDEKIQPQVLISTKSQLGDGHQAKVYSASTAKGTKNICVKVFEPFKDTDQLYWAETEHKVLQKLKGHPNIVQIYEFERNKKIMINGKE